MNVKSAALIAVLLIVGCVWFFKSGKEYISPEKQEALLKCARPECSEEFTKQVPLTFSKYPVKCPKCGQTSAFILATCWSCTAHYAFDAKNPPAKCPACGVELPH